MCIRDRAYAEKIKQLDKPLREKLSQIPADQRWLVTSEGAFSYLAKDYDLKEMCIRDRSKCFTTT